MDELEKSKKAFEEFVEKVRALMKEAEEEEKKNEKKSV